MSAPRFAKAARCAWDGVRSLDEMTLGSGFHPTLRWVLESVDDLGASQSYVDPRAGVGLLVIDGIVTSLTCHREFRMGKTGRNLIGGTLNELEDVVGRLFLPDPSIGEVIFECPDINLSCIAYDDGIVVQVSLEDFEHIADAPDPKPLSGAG